MEGDDGAGDRRRGPDAVARRELEPRERPVAGDGRREPGVLDADLQRVARGDGVGLALAEQQRKAAKDAEAVAEREKKAAAASEPVTPKASEPKSGTTEEGTPQGSSPSGEAAALGS